MLDQGPNAPNVGDRADDQARVAPHQLGNGQAEALHRAGAEVLDDHVRAVAELERERVGAGRAQVERDGALAAVELRELRGEVGSVGDGEAPAHLALRALDLDHRSAVVGEHPRAQGAGDDVREVDDLQAVIRAGLSCHLAAEERSTLP